MAVQGYGQSRLVAGRKNLVLAACAATILLAAACQRPPAAQEEKSPTLDPADVAFGYTDNTGTRLRMLTLDNDVTELTKAKGMESAVCSEARIFPIRHLQFQQGTANNNGRQSAGNLVNDRGHLFEIVGGPADDGDTCMLVPPRYFKDFPVVPTEARGPAGGFEKEAVTRIEKEKGRKVALYRPLHSSGPSQQVASVEFEPVAASLLGSLVLVERDRLSFWDVPASLKEGRERGGCWRVDDDCRFNSKEMDVHAVFGTGDRKLVFFTSWGPEGQLIKLFEAKDGTLLQLADGYRYHSPI